MGYTHPYVELGRSAIQGHGLFARAPIPKGTFLCSWSGYPVHRTHVPLLTNHAKRYIIRVRGSNDFMLSTSLLKDLLRGELDLHSIGAMFMCNSAIDCNCLRDDIPINQYNKLIGQPMLPRDLAGLLRNVIVLKAARDIQPGEELTFNYPVTM